MTDTERIPRIIHYCWFGGAPKPESVLRCIDSWKKYCPDFEIREWTEKDVDLTMNAYTKQAYDARVWGFVPDYIRLWIIYHYGGIYLDTDVEIIKDLSPLCKNTAFAGFETQTHVAFGLGFGAEAGNAIIEAHMKMYDNLQFVKEDGTYNKIPSPQYTTQILREFGLQENNNEVQNLAGMKIYPREFFNPYDWQLDKMQITSNTYSIHHYSASWFTPEEKKIHAVSVKLLNRFGPVWGYRLSRIHSFPYRVKMKVKTLGMSGTVKFAWQKLFGKRQNNGS